MLTLYSATHGMSDIPDPFYYLRRQLLWFGIGIGVMLLICFVDYINFQHWARYFYAVTLVLLAAVLFIGRAAKGSMRWIPLGPFDLQPSEVAKILMIIVLAKLLADREGKLNRFQDLLVPLLATMVPMVLIFLQPDLGTSLVFIVLLLGLLYMAGAKRNHLLIIIGAGLAAFPLLWFKLLKDYQKMRLMVFLNPDLDPTESGYQLLQSMIGIGSGGLTGKGLFNSTQVRLDFLPEHHTDFIFSVLGEEMGFLGAAGVLLLYFLLIYRILWTATQAKDQFGALICCGVAIILSFQILVNIGMTISMMPVTGIPLPFMSYGNNALLVNLMCIGLVLNVGMRRHKIQF
ncbi:MAG: rod shape-determining protein RodA [Firmicutes bacterium]|nr:rod shape-determining protein RodA [Bacillota bacterium]